MQKTVHEQVMQYLRTMAPFPVCDLCLTDNVKGFSKSAVRECSRRLTKKKTYTRARRFCGVCGHRRQCTFETASISFLIEFIYAEVVSAASHLALLEELDKWLDSDEMHNASKEGLIGPTIRSVQASLSNSLILTLARLFEHHGQKRQRLCFGSLFTIVESNPGARRRFFPGRKGEEKYLRALELWQDFEKLSTLRGMVTAIQLKLDGKPNNLVREATRELMLSEKLRHERVHIHAHNMGHMLKHSLSYSDIRTLYSRATQTACLLKDATSRTGVPFEPIEETMRERATLFWQRFFEAPQNLT